MKLLTQEQLAKLTDNGRRQAAVKGTPDEMDFHPVVKLFYPASAATWLLTELDPEEPDVAWGLCDLGVGFPEFGTVLISELTEFGGLAHRARPVLDGQRPDIRLHRRCFRCRPHRPATKSGHRCHSARTTALHP